MRKIFAHYDDNLGSKNLADTYKETPTELGWGQNNEKICKLFSMIISKEEKFKIENK